MNHSSSAAAPAERVSFEKAIAVRVNFSRARLGNATLEKAEIHRSDSAARCCKA
jgi:uncharacterized protein YjbI with pentapeptide repeats